MAEQSLYARALAQIRSPEPDFIAAYRQWHAETDRLNERLRVPYKYSDEYDEILADYWRAYDALEAARRQFHLPHPMPWCEEIDDDREYDSRRGRLEFYPMQDNFLRVCPLWVHMGRVAGEANDDRRYSWKATLDNWQSFTTHVQEASFEGSLSPSQRSSCKILKDWWSSSYTSESLTEAAKEYMRERVNLVATRPMVLLRNLQPTDDYTLYHSFLLELFNLEFNPAAWEPNASHIKLYTLQLHRYDASRHAVAQRMAYSNFGEPRPPPRTKYPTVTLSNETWYGNKTSCGLPHYLWDNETHKTVTASGIRPRPEYMCISHTWGRWRLPSSIHVTGVPWPVPENSRYKVQDVPAQLSALPSRYIWFDLFCIPQQASSKLKDDEISRQAAIFRGSTACIAWLYDLTDWAGVKRALEWLCLNYLSVTSMPDGVVAAARGERMQKAWKDADVPAELVHELFEDTDSDTKRRRDLLVKPIPWFTSLWTFQEALLCPDIQLYSRTWTRLEDGQGFPITLATLANSISLLTDIVREDIDTAGNRETDYIGGKRSITDPTYFHTWLLSPEFRHPLADDLKPLGVLQLESFLWMTKMDRFFVSRSASTSFIGASGRECTGDRTEALMSAIGVTAWFKSRAGWRRPLGLLDRTVLGMYKLNFVQAAFSSHGSSFLHGDWYEDGRLQPRDLLQRRSLNSMLPFDKPAHSPFAKTTRHGIEENDGLHIEVVDHPSIAGWKIRADGSIRAHSAGIWASSEDEKPFEFDVTLKYKVGRERLVLQKEELCEELRKIDAQGVVYAVALFKDGIYQEGVLLQSPRKTVLGRRYLLNVGRIRVQGFREEMPPVRKVNWVIL